MESDGKMVTYEQFGAVGDGVADDLPAIRRAHEHANANGLPIRSRPDATYHLGRQALTAVIATDTDWNTSRFTIDDTDVDDHKASLFEVRSLLEPEQLSISRVSRDQKALDVRPSRDCHVTIENEGRKVYKRRGLNKNDGYPQHDCFILRRDGSIEGDIDWEYETVTRVDARPIDETPLVIRGGVFTTFANRMKQDVGYNYWSRNIMITRSRTEVVGLTHYVVGETSVGHPYAGFLNIRGCAEITLRDCFATGHKIYSTIGAAGKPVNMGSYDISVNEVVNFRMIGCTMNHVTDSTRWGVIGSNFCKNIVLENCVLSRMDTHMGVSGSYTVRGCKLGHMGLNAIGRGTLTVADSTIHRNSFINLRADYGSTWEGTVVIKNCRWIPASGVANEPVLFSVTNDGMHDFGYPCYMPEEVLIDGLAVDDSNYPAGYEGLYLFSDPDDGEHDGPLPPHSERPYPIALPQKVTIRGLTTASGKKPRVSPNPAIVRAVSVVTE